MVQNRRKICEVQIIYERKQHILCWGRIAIFPNWCRDAAHQSSLVLISDGGGIAKSKGIKIEVFPSLSKARRTHCLNLTFESVHRKGTSILPIACKKKTNH